ncbi:MAG: VWA domain-containing protein [Chloroflexi bacterium]|nr:VWA domain-containing protein [Chloroflexota bacterium]
MIAGSSEPDGGIALHNVLLLGRMLRHAGLPIGPGRVIDLVRALEQIDLTRRDDVRITVRSLLISRREDFDKFDRIFDMFWDALVALGMRFDLPVDPSAIDANVTRLPDDAGGRGDGQAGGPERQVGQQGRSQLSVGATGSNDVDIDMVLMYSNAEVLRGKDFEKFSADELAEARRLMEEMRWEATRYESRRKRPAAKGAHLDPRRVIRRNLRYGGEIIDLTFKEPKLKRRPLVLICDISGSMDRYSRLLLQFLYTVHRGAEKVEAFVFGTRLTRITRQLRNRDVDTAIEQVSKIVEDWSGGTRIGESLAMFNRRWARRVLGQGAIVVIISDGWDRGDPAVLRKEMEHLQRLTHRLIWMNPLLGMEGYQPITQGLQAALPYVDDFIPAHNLDSLEELGHLLDRVQKRRPVRHQHHDVA